MVHIVDDFVGLYLDKPQDTSNDCESIGSQFLTDDYVADKIELKLDE